MSPPRARLFLMPLLTCSCGMVEASGSLLLVLSSSRGHAGSRRSSKAQQGACCGTNKSEEAEGVHVYVRKGVCVCVCVCEIDVSAGSGRGHAGSPRSSKAQQGVH
jgi:hypothetical protein